MTDLNKTAANFDLFSKVLFVIDYNESDLRRSAAEAAAAEVGCTREVPVKNVKLFCDRTGNYAEVIIPSGGDTACGMKMCVIVDTDTMEVCGVCPVD